jgi:peptidoglycan/LPS O-acetylase OafA/YrhL
MPNASAISQHTERPSRVFYPALDGLRAVAFLLIFFQHYYALPWGWAGVNVFFVLSGFLITGILFDARNDAHRARNFYIRRALRILPLYYGIFAVMLLLAPFLHWQWSAWWIAWPLYVGNFLRYVSPEFLVADSPLQLAANAWLRTPLLPHVTFYLGHFWSLCVEEQFYLLWPWVVFWVRSRRALLWICVSAVVLIPFLRILTQDTAPAWMLQGNLLYCTLPFQLDSLLLGGLAALLWRGTHSGQLIFAARITATITSLIAIVYYTLTVHPTQLLWREHYLYHSWKLTWGLTFINILAASIIVCCLSATSWITTALSIAPLRWLGRISYGAYIFHDIFHVVFTNILNRLALQHRFFMQHGEKPLLFVALSTTLLFADLSYRFFETPFLHLKRRFTLHNVPS